MCKLVQHLVPVGVTVNLPVMPVSILNMDLCAAKCIQCLSVDDFFGIPGLTSCVSISPAFVSLQLLYRRKGLAQSLSLCPSPH